MSSISRVSSTNTSLQSQASHSNWRHSLKTIAKVSLVAVLALTAAPVLASAQERTWKHNPATQWQESDTQLVAQAAKLGENSRDLSLQMQRRSEEMTYDGYDALDMAKRIPDEEIRKATFQNLRFLPPN